MITCDLCGKTGRSDKITTFKIVLKEDGHELGDPEFEVSLCQSNCLDRFTEKFTHFLGHMLAYQADRG